MRRRPSILRSAATVSRVILGDDKDYWSPWSRPFQRLIAWADVSAPIRAIRSHLRNQRPRLSVSYQQTSGSDRANLVPEAKPPRYCSNCALCSAEGTDRRGAGLRRLECHFSHGQGPAVPVSTGWTLCWQVQCTDDMRTMTTAPHFDRNTGGVDGISAHAPQTHSGAMVVVQRDWSDWRTAMVRLTDLDNIHWSQPSGAPRPLIHASVCCDKIVSGEIAHECHLTPCPHSLVVCVLKSHAGPCVFEELARRADEVDSAARRAHPLSRGGDRLAGVD